MKTREHFSIFNFFWNDYLLWINCVIVIVRNMFKSLPLSNHPSRPFVTHCFQPSSLYLTCCALPHLVEVLSNIINPCSPYPTLSFFDPEPHHHITYKLPFPQHASSFLQEKFKNSLKLNRFMFESFVLNIFSSPLFTT